MVGSHHGGHKVAQREKTEAAPLPLGGGSEDYSDRGQMNPGDGMWDEVDRSKSC